ncbi:hypothetical protein [Peribacillus sp. SCS-155]|uniref:hypothetical protein n=1 Tax=Peribacillus sedimenti TaxID=3115297 RepID=UPI003905CE3D
MKLPEILAGPILRRVEYDQVYIWIASSSPYKIEAQLYSISKKNYQPLKANSKQQTAKIGSNLYINLIQVTPAMRESFPFDCLLGYNLTFSMGSIHHDLKSLGLLDSFSPDAIVYGDLKYPAFYLTEDTKSRILYGSCRKLDGNGHDAIRKGDELLKSTFSELDERPEALFLLGNQIYADDVSAPIMSIVRKLANKLNDREENLIRIEPRLGREPYASLDELNGRKKIAAELCCFTSTSAENHLFRFNEYAAMYLLSWNPSLWELSNFDSNYTDSLSADVFFDIKESLKPVRRILANIPTYMIFNEHDLTSDWNISGDWKQSVWKSALGRHVITNGLSAYWAFQGWGNMPSCFDSSFVKRLTSGLRSYPSKDNYHDWLVLLWEFNCWQFTAPTYPNAVFLDIRTHREYIFSKKEKVGCLINKLGWFKAADTLYEFGWEPGDPLLIASPLPLYSIARLINKERKRRVLPISRIGFPVLPYIPGELSHLPNVGRYNGDSFDYLHKWILDLNPELCVILSGDAKFSFSVSVDALYLDGDRKKIHQFTSSPLKNNAAKGLKGHILKTMLSVPPIAQNKHAQSQMVIDHHFTHEILSKEFIHYDQLDKGSLIQQENNIGVLTVSGQDVQNTFLKLRNSTDFAINSH